VTRFLESTARASGAAVSGPQSAPTPWLRRTARRQATRAPAVAHHAPLCAPVPQAAATGPLRALLGGTGPLSGLKCTKGALRVPFRGPVSRENPPTVRVSGRKRKPHYPGRHTRAYAAAVSPYLTDSYGYPPLAHCHTIATADCCIASGAALSPVVRHDGVAP